MLSAYVWSTQFSVYAHKASLAIRLRSDPNATFGGLMGCPLQEHEACDMPLSNWHLDWNRGRYFDFVPFVATNLERDSRYAKLHCLKHSSS